MKIKKSLIVCLFVMLMLLELVALCSCGDFNHVDNSTAISNKQTTVTNSGFYAEEIKADNGSSVTVYVIPTNFRNDVNIAEAEIMFDNADDNIEGYGEKYIYHKAGKDGNRVRTHIENHLRVVVTRIVRDKERRIEWWELISITTGEYIGFVDKYYIKTCYDDIIQANLNNSIITEG